MDWNCGGATITSLTDSAGSYVTVYCGSCAASPGTWCEANNPSFTGVGRCGGTNPLVYPFQTGLIHMLEAMGENDTTDYDSEYSYIQNIKDGRGYTIGTVGFCTGTGDFIVVARCLNDLEPSNLLAKYWPGLVAIDDAFYKLDANNADTSPVDKLGSFVADVTSAGTNDKTYRACQDTMADADYLDTALQHAQERGLKGALTIGFLYDTELNFGDQDDPNGGGGGDHGDEEGGRRLWPGRPHGLHRLALGGEPLARVRDQRTDDRHGDRSERHLGAGHGPERDLGGGAPAAHGEVERPGERNGPLDGLRLRECLQGGRRECAMLAFSTRQNGLELVHLRHRAEQDRR